MSDKLRIAAYTRISVDEEIGKDNTSIENQKSIIADYCASNFPGCSVDYYEDRDQSGYKFEQREDYYYRLRPKLFNGEYDILIVKDLSRFSRRNGKGLAEFEDIVEHDVRIIAIGDSVDYSEDNTEDSTKVKLYFFVNEIPVTDASRKVKAVIEERRKGFRWVCAVPYGYKFIDTKKMTYEPDPPAAEVVKEIFRLYNDGWGYKKIANHLTDKGVPTPRAHEIEQKLSSGTETRLKAKNEWSIITVSEIITNDFYIGTLRLGKTKRKGINGKDVRLDKEKNIVKENAHPGIIDVKTFEQAQEQLSVRSRSHYRGEKKYPTDYSGYLFCGDCGSPMFSMSRTDCHPAYRCGTYHRRGTSGCTSHHIRVDLLDEMLKSHLMLVRDNCQGMMQQLEEAIADQPNRDKELSTSISSIEDQLNSYQAQLATLYQQKIIALAGCTDTQARIKGQAFDDMEDNLVRQIERLEGDLEKKNDLRNTIIKTNRKAKTVIDIFNDIANKKRLSKQDIGLIVDRIDVFEDHIDVKLKSDVDALLSLDSSEETVNFPVGSKDIVIVQKSAKRADKVFTVNVVNSGDPLEIFTDHEGEVIFKKYSPIGELGEFASQYADTLHKTCSLSVVICDRDSVIASAGVPKKEYADKKLTPEFDELIDARSLYKYSGGSGIKVTDGASACVTCAMPILAEGDIIGCVAALSDESEDGGTARPGEIEVKLIQTAAGFFGRQLES